MTGEQHSATIAPLYAAYLGEVYGIAFFTSFVESYSDKRQEGKLQALLGVEQFTEQYLHTALTALGCDCSSQNAQMTAKGKEDADVWLSLSWQPLISTLIDWATPYQQLYQQQAEQASEHHQLFKLVADHESTIVTFLQAEQQGEPASLNIISAFYQAWQKS